MPFGYVKTCERDLYHFYFENSYLRDGATYISKNSEYSTRKSEERKVRHVIDWLDWIVVGRY